jgi:hypothetical protein
MHARRFEYPGTHNGDYVEGLMYFGHWRLQSSLLSVSSARFDGYWLTA